MKSDSDESLFGSTRQEYLVMKRVTLAFAALAAMGLAGCETVDHDKRLSIAEKAAINRCIDKRTASGFAALVSPLGSLVALGAANSSDDCKIADKKWADTHR